VITVATALPEPRQAVRGLVSLADRARELYDRALADPAETCLAAAALVSQARDAACPEGLALALRTEACARRGVLEHEAARVLLDEALRVARRVRSRTLLADILIGRAAVNQELGWIAAAQRDIERATPLVSSTAAAELLLQQAALYQNAGRLAQAAVIYRRLISNEDARVDVLAKIANNLALIEIQLGRPAAAFARVDEAAIRARQVGPALVALVAQTRAWVTLQAGRVGESLRQFDRAGALYRQAGLPLGEHHLEHADALLDLRLVSEADALASRAAAEFDAHGVGLMAAEARLRVARLALMSGDAERAAHETERAAAIFHKQGRSGWAAQAVVIAAEASIAAGRTSGSILSAAVRAAETLEDCHLSGNAVEAHLAAGRIACELGRLPSAITSLTRAAQLAAPRSTLVRLKGHLAAATAARLQSQDQEVLRHCRHGLRDLARHRVALPSIELRALASGHGIELGRMGLDVLVREGRASRVLEWLERTRAAALVAVEPPEPDVVHEDLAALRSVQAEMAQLQGGQETQSQRLLSRQAVLEGRIRRATWVSDTVDRGSQQLLGCTELRRALDGRVLAEYAVLDGELLAVVLEPRRSRLVRLGSLRPVQIEAEALLFALRRLARPTRPASLAAARMSADKSLRRLTDSLLGPLRIAADEPMLVVPSAALRLIPWSALHPASVAVAPSAASWAASRASRRIPEARTVLIAGPDLPGALTEVDRLRRLHENPVVLTPPESTTDAALKALAGADLAHLACHGRLRSDSPTFSSLVLSDGELTLHEMYLRGVAPRRLVLASCDSGADIEYAGDEVLGFVGATLARGAGGVVASSVTVPDGSVIPLMCGLHEAILRGASLADALHEARRGLDLGQPEEFAAWCAFNAFGAA
jgi:tetratricopeptide (TPR) repeat protein